MASVDRLTAAFRHLQRQFGSKGKGAKSRSAFLSDMQGLVEEDEDVRNILNKRTLNNKFVAVTFDRNKNDNSFSYTYFDFLLASLDRISGGRGLYKPLHQMRALQWCGSRSDLHTVLIFFGRHNPSIRVASMLILPFPEPVIGKGISTKVYKK